MEIGLAQHLAVVDVAAVVVVVVIVEGDHRRGSPSTSQRPPGDHLLVSGKNIRWYQGGAGRILSFNHGQAVACVAIVGRRVCYSTSRARKRQRKASFPTSSVHDATLLKPACRSPVMAFVFVA